MLAVLALCFQSWACMIEWEIINYFYQDGEGDSYRILWYLKFCNWIGGYGFWMAMDESIRMESFDVMWCRLGNWMGLSFGLSLEFWNSGIRFIQIACANFPDFTSLRDFKLIVSISGTFKLIGHVLKEIELVRVLWNSFAGILWNSGILFNSIRLCELSKYTSCKPVRILLVRILFNSIRVVQIFQISRRTATLE